MIVTVTDKASQTGDSQPTTWTVDTDRVQVRTVLNGQDVPADTAHCVVVCQTCGTYDLGAGLFDSSGAGLCLDCSLHYGQPRKGSLPAEIISTDQQRLSLADWDLQGIGTD